MRGGRKSRRSLGSRCIRGNPTVRRRGVVIITSRGQRPGATGWVASVRPRAHRRICRPTLTRRVRSAFAAAAEGAMCASRRASHDRTRLTIGFPRMYIEPGSAAPSCPRSWVAAIPTWTCSSGGQRGGRGTRTRLTGRVPRCGCGQATRAQDVVVVLRARRSLRAAAGSILVSSSTSPRAPSGRMLRPGDRAIALDMVTGDDAAAGADCATWPATGWRRVRRAGAALAPLLVTGPRPVSVRSSALGRGQARHRVGGTGRARGAHARLLRRPCRGRVVVAEQNLSGNEAWFGAAWRDESSYATARRDTSRPRSQRLAGLAAEHAIVCDLAVVPYLIDETRRGTRDRGHPAGHLDQWEFGPDDPPGSGCRRAFPYANGARSCPATLWARRRARALH